MGVEDAWSLSIDVNKEGSLNTGVGDCDDYVLAKYAALHQAGMPDENLRMVLVRDNAVRPYNWRSDQRDIIHHRSEEDW
jgi:predicted transglutaminase-like cysteine proteinase